MLKLLFTSFSNDLFFVDKAMSSVYQLMNKPIQDFYKVYSFNLLFQINVQEMLDYVKQNSIMNNMKESSFSNLFYIVLRLNKLIVSISLLDSSTKTRINQSSAKAHSKELYWQKNWGTKKLLQSSSNVWKFIWIFISIRMKKFQLYHLSFWQV